MIDTEFIQEVRDSIETRMEDPTPCTEWESDFLISMLNFNSFSKKQLAVIERLCGPFRHNVNPFASLEKQVSEPAILPLQLESKKKIMKCRHCNKDFELKLGKPGYANECPECLL